MEKFNRSSSSVVPVQSIKNNYIIEPSAPPINFMYNNDYVNNKLPINPPIPPICENSNYQLENKNKPSAPPEDLIANSHTHFKNDTNKVQPYQYHPNNIKLVCNNHIKKNKSTCVII